MTMRTRTTSSLDSTVGVYDNLEVYRDSQGNLQVAEERPQHTGSVRRPFDNPYRFGAAGGVGGPARPPTTIPRPTTPMSPMPTRPDHLQIVPVRPTTPTRPTPPARPAPSRPGIRSDPGTTNVPFTSPGYRPPPGSFPGHRVVPPRTARPGRNISPLLAGGVAASTAFIPDTGPRTGPGQSTSPALGEATSPTTAASPAPATSPATAAALTTATPPAARTSVSRGTASPTGGSPMGGGARGVRRRRRRPQQTKGRTRVSTRSGYPEEVEHTETTTYRHNLKTNVTVARVTKVSSTRVTRAGQTPAQSTARLVGTKKVRPSGKTVVAVKARNKQVIKWPSGRNRT